MGVFALTMINISTILSIRNWPLTAEYGLASITYLLVATLIYFVPIALVSAELATGWPQKGGVFVWISEAFGKRIGFVAAFLLWFSNVVWYPAILSFVAVTIAYAFNPEWAENPYYQFWTVLAVFWAVLIFNLRGVRFSSLLSTWGVLLGTLLPGALLIFFGITWYASGNPSQIPLTWEACIPRIGGADELVFIAGVLLGFAGMEMTAVHAQDVEHPTRNYPRAILYSSIVIVGLTLVGTLSVAIIIPPTEIGLVTACLESLKMYLTHYNLGWTLPFISILVAFGSIGGISSWLAGPCRSLHKACEELSMHPILTKETRGMPLGILLIQGAVVTAISVVFLVMPSVSSSFWLLTCLSAQMYLVVYFLLFMAGIALRFKQPNVHRTYRVPGGQFGMLLAGILGIVNTAFCCYIGFLPPAQLDVGNRTSYIAFLVIGMAVSILAPYAYAGKRKAVVRT